MRSDDGGSGDRYANGEGRPQETPALIRVAVSGATELLKVFSLPNEDGTDIACLDRLSDAEEFENSTCSVDDVVRILKSDYEKDYFVTAGPNKSQWPIGFCELESLPPIYTPKTTFFKTPLLNSKVRHCMQRNLKLLATFFGQPSIVLLSIEKGEDAGKSILG